MDLQPSERRRQRHQDVVQTQPEIGAQDNRSSAKAIRQRSHYGRTQKLHQSPDRVYQSEDGCRVRRLASDEMDDQFRQDRDDHPERQNVEHDGNEDEDHRRAAWSRRDVRFAH